MLAQIGKFLWDHPSLMATIAFAGALATIFFAMWLTGELPDIALVDLVLPGESDGLQVIGRIIDKYPSVKIIAMSGDNSSESYFRALRLRGVSHALPKPIALNDLASAISKVTGIEIEDLGDDLIG